MKRFTKVQAKKKIQEDKKSITQGFKHSSKLKQTKQTKQKENLPIKGELSYKRNNVVSNKKTEIAKPAQAILDDNKKVKGYGHLEAQSQLRTFQNPLQDIIVSDNEQLLCANIQDSQNKKQMSEKSTTSSRSQKQASTFLTQEVRDLLCEESSNDEALDSMILRSGLELPKHAFKADYEQFRNVQYHSSSSKKSKQSRKTSKDCTPISEESLQDYFQDTSNFNIIKSKSSIDESIESVQKIFEQAAQEFEIHFLTVQLNDFNQAIIPIHQTDDDLNMAQEISECEGQLNFSFREKKIVQLLNCIQIEGQVLWEVEWDEIPKEEENNTYEYESVLKTQYSDEFESKKQQFLNSK